VRWYTELAAAPLKAFFRSDLWEKVIEPSIRREVREQSTTTESEVLCPHCGKPVLAIVMRTTFLGKWTKKERTV
jgi:hypothetical protein